MSKIQKILFGSFILVLAILVYAEATKKQPINWFPSYSKADKIPLGTYVFHDVLSNKMGEHFTEVNRPPFEILKDSTYKGTYFFVNDVLSFDRIETERLLNWTAKGNTLFLASSVIPKIIKDTLELETSVAYQEFGVNSQPVLNFTNRTLKRDSTYHISRDFLVNYFSKIDTLTQVGLGVADVYNDTLLVTRPNVNFLKAPFGNGTILLHLQPEIFSNYVLLSEENVELSEKTLSYIPKNVSLIWDNYYKTGKPINISPLKAILTNKYLKWAYYIVLIGVILFVLFEGKRKQRSIPIVKPLQNKTFEYTQTISGMYLDKQENHKIAIKQINLFLEFVRTRLRVPTIKIDNRFFKTVAARSGNTIEDTKEIFTLFEKIELQLEQNTSPEDLEKLYKTITQYKQKIDGKS